MKSTSMLAMLLAGLLIAACGQRSADTFSLSAIASPAGTGSAEPHLAISPAGIVVLSWLEPGQEGTSLNYSVLQGDGWAPARRIARGKDWFVNWADFPSVTPITERTWAAHWLVRRPGGTYSYDVAIAVSTDAGATWGEPVTPHDDGTRTEHGFVSLFPWQSGIGALWLDGRNMAEDGHHAHGESGPGSGMTLRAAQISPAGEVTDSRLIDDLVCDCCQTDVAVAAGGPVAVYRNRTAGEVRDIYVSRAFGGDWLPGIPVADDGWTINGCPVNGPAIAAQGAEVAVAWFTSADNLPRVRFSRSADGAASFSAPADIDAPGALGRVDVELLGNGDAVVSWLRSGADGQAELCARKIARAGELGPVRVIARASAARMSGFPQMIRRGNELVFAWTDASGEAPQVRSARATGF